ncbi:hypothetical protein BDEG_26847 [Batrachochytrium dendrobatidis JEL423]|uniref:IST1 homolog n=2 Tax=Batrachochytrium dendrobatidis TaxID=109871 RepID=A0A177WTM9_BATDL|nr:hypothetical protein BDEG_26847 [Batrachochytrium dendrobatidis JEL423]
MHSPTSNSTLCSHVEIHAVVQLKVALNRLKLVQQKKASINQQARKEIALLLEKGKEESARVRVEHIIHDDYFIEALELIELYTETLLARFGIVESMKTCDPGIAEAVNTIIYAAPRIDIKELHFVRDQLVSKYGKDFGSAAMENFGYRVNDRIVQKLKAQTPDRKLVDQYLVTIAGAYNVNWEPPIAPPSPIVMKTVLPLPPALELNEFQKPEYQSNEPDIKYPPAQPGQVFRQMTMTREPAIQQHAATVQTGAIYDPGQFNQVYVQQPILERAPMAENYPMQVPMQYGNSSMPTIAPPLQQQQVYQQATSPMQYNNPSMQVFPGQPPHQEPGYFYGQLQQLPAFPATPPVHDISNTVNSNSSSSNMPDISDETPDFDQLAKRFEALKKRK